MDEKITNKQTFEYINRAPTKEEAKIIRKLRCELGDVGGWPLTHSWRSIASIAFTDFNGMLDERCDGNQLAGIEICKYCAEHFNEDHQKEPWN